MEHVTTLYHFGGWWKWISSSGVLMKRNHLTFHISWKAEVFWLKSWLLTLKTWISIAILNWNIFNDFLFGFTPQTKLRFGLLSLGVSFLCLCISVERFIFTAAIEISQAFRIELFFVYCYLIFYSKTENSKFQTWIRNWNFLNNVDNDKMCIFIYYY